MTGDTPTPHAPAQGPHPQGRDVVTPGSPPAPLGFVASLVQQVGFDPPTICLAIAKGRDHLEAIKACGGFTLSILDAESSGCMGAFFKKREGGSTPYGDLDTSPAPSGLPVLNQALAWLDCKLTGEHPGGDHDVIFACVDAGGLTREGDPSVHLRTNGLGY